MNLENYYEYCLSKKAVTEHFPFDEDTLVFKVGNKMFALANLSSFENVQLLLFLINKIRSNYQGSF